MIFLGIIKENAFSHTYDGDMDIMKIYKGALMIMREKTIVGNIYKLLESIVVSDVVPFEYGNATPKF